MEKFSAVNLKFFTKFLIKRLPHFHPILHSGSDGKLCPHWLCVNAGDVWSVMDLPPQEASSSISKCLP